MSHRSMSRSEAARAFSPPLISRMTPGQRPMSPRSLLPVRVSRSACGKPRARAARTTAVSAAVPICLGRLTMLRVLSERDDVARLGGPVGCGQGRGGERGAIASVGEDDGDVARGALHPDGAHAGYVAGRELVAAGVAPQLV